MNATHTVYDATTGSIVLDRATEKQFDRWYDHHCFWRAVRAPEEVNPSARERYEATRNRSDVHWLVNGAGD